MKARAVYIYKEQARRRKNQKVFLFFVLSKRIRKVEQAAKEAGIPDDLIFSDQPMIKNPSPENCNKKASDGAKISCKFCDAKIKSNHASKRGRKRVARIRSDTDLG